MQSCRQAGVLLFWLAVLCAAASAQQSSGTGSLHGQVTDPTGAVVVGAEITVTAADGTVRKTTSNALGIHVMHGLAEGEVILGATAPGFAEFEMQNVVVRAGETQRLDITLVIAMKHEQITVEAGNGGALLDVNPESNAGALVLKDEELDALPDDPDELQQELQALAGPTPGLNGAQIYVDGFSGGRLPPKSSIREVRINQNPFSAEFDKPGYGHVEVFTKPGSEKWHGQLAINGNHSVFNSRNPYVQGEVPEYHSAIYEGNLSGAMRKNLSVFLDAQRRDISGLAVVSEIPDVLPQGLAVPSPRRRTNVGGRLDWQATANNTVTARYQFESNLEDNRGVVGITLPSRGFNLSETEHAVRLSHTQVLGPRVIQQTNFQFIRGEYSQTGNALDAGAAINVLGEFNAGGSTVGRSRLDVDRYELLNLTSWAAGRHLVKFGGRLRVAQKTSISEANFNGTITYSSPAAYLSGTPSQLSIVSGSPRTALTYADVAVYAEDDWKLRPNLTLSYGLRFESQNAIADKADFAPRLSLAWGLDGGKDAPQTVLRFGYGIFYDRFPDDLVLQAQRLNGVTQSETVANAVSGPIQCPPGTLPPTAIDISQCDFSGTDSQSIYRIHRSLRSPYSMQSAAGVERQLGRIGSLSLNYLHTRGVHQLILLNVNAPLPGQGDETRPFFSTVGAQNIYEYNSAAVFRQNQIITNLQLRLGKKISVMGYYALGWINSNTGGPTSSPSNQYDLSEDYGRANSDVRHRLYFSGSAWLASVRISPFVIVNSGAPFNITTGRDNGSTFFNERPSFGIPGAPGVITTKYGSFNVNPAPGEPRIPINYGNGPANITVNVRLSRTFGFGPETGEDGGESRTSRPARERRGGLGAASHGFGGLFVPGGTSRRLNLTLTVVARNVFNFSNPGTPIGVLPDPASCPSGILNAPDCISDFGKSVSLAGGPFSSGAASRRVDFQAMFAF